MSEIKVNSIKGVGASAAAVTVHNSDGTCTLASGSKLNNCTTDGTTNLTIADGNLVVGTAGHGIDFSATSDSSGTTSSELLDDYEEGTFTPFLYYVSGTSGVVHATQQGRYTKVGRLVSFQIRLAITNKGSGNNNVRIGALPYVPDSSGLSFDYFFITAIVGCDLGAGRVPFVQMEDYTAGRLTLYSFDYASSSSYAELNSTDITDSFNIGIQGNYVTAS